MKGFLQEKGCLLSPDQIINVPSTPFAIPDLTPKCGVASKVAMAPATESGGYDGHDHYSRIDGGTISTSLPESANMNKLTPDYVPSGATTAESEFEKLRKIDLSYLTLFRRSARFSNRGFNHFFLSQELKCDDHFMLPSAHDLSNSNSSGYGRDSSLGNGHESLPPNYRRNTSSTTVNSNGVQSNGNLSTKSVDSHAIYNMSFSHDGKYLASAGADGLIRIWEVITSEMYRHTNNAHSLNVPVKPHRKSFIENAIDETLNDLGSIINGSDQKTKSSSKSRRNTLESYDSATTDDSKANSHHSIKNTEYAPVFKSKPVKTFYHEKTVNSLDWSKNNFLLSSSEDGTAKLWHVDRADCLQTYKFDSIVTCAKFHKSDDRFFVASQWNGRVLFLSILEREVIYEVNLNKSITCFDFCPHSKRLFVGCDKGYIFTLKIDGGLIIESDYHIKRKHNMPRIIGIVTFMDDTKECPKHQSASSYPKNNSINNNNKVNTESEPPFAVKVLISCNDSKIRLFNFSEKFLEVRYSGYTNKASTISASINEDQTHVISGSDDGWTYLWQLYSDKRNKIENEKKLFTKAHFDILNYFKDDTCLIDNKYYGSFHTHNNRCNVSIFAPRASLKLLELSNDPIFDLKHQYSSLVAESHIKDLEVDDLSTAIIVSTDNTGKIKVFRRDFSRYIRKALQGKKASQLLDRKQSVLSRGLSKKVMNRNSLVIPNYEATTMNIADTMSSVYMDPDATFRGRGKKGYVRPANKYAVESSIVPPKSSSSNATNATNATNISDSCKIAKHFIPKINIEKQLQRNNMVTSTPDISTSSYSGKTSSDDINSSTLKGSDLRHDDDDLKNGNQSHDGKLGSVPLNTSPSLTSESSRGTYSSSSKNSIQVSDSVKNIDDEIKKVLVETPHVGVLHEIGQKQHSHSNQSLVQSEESGLVKGNVYIEKATHHVKDGGVKESQVVSIPLDVGNGVNRHAEGWSDVGDGKYTCAKCQGVNFTPHPMNSGTTNQIRFYCDDCGQEAKIE